MANSSDINIEKLVQACMSSVKLQLQEAYPQTYKKFLHSMLEFDSKKINATECLQSVRDILCDFPLLVRDFEMMYGMLLKSTEDISYPAKRKRENAGY